jgi:3-isopropylmalate/(R)-2-methylmalate dehydratase small subunit
VPAITLPLEEVNRLLALAADPARCEMTVDLEQQLIVTPGDARMLRFDFDPLRRHMLLKGLDAVGVTMEYADEIREFEQDYFARQPWLA